MNRIKKNELKFF